MGRGCSVLTAAPQGECNDFSNFTDPETQSLRGQVKHFPKSCSQTVAEPGTWNELCLISRLVLFFTIGIFSFCHFLIAKFVSSQKVNWLFFLVLEHKNLFPYKYFRNGDWGCKVLYSLGVEIQRCPAGP